MRRSDGVHVSVAAFHEAGHAMAALWQGVAVYGIYLRSDRPGEGGMRYTSPRYSNPYDPTRGHGCAQAAWCCTLHNTLREVRILLAGPLAEARILNKPLRALGARSDLDKCEYLMQRLEICRKWLQQYFPAPSIDIVGTLSRERTRVRRWLGRPIVENATQRIAGRLSEQSTVIADELSGLIGAEPELKSIALPFYGSGLKVSDQ